MNIVKLIAAIGIPLAIQSFGTALEYWTGQRDLFHYITLMLALTVGVYIFQFIEFSNLRHQRILIAIYAAGCLAALLWITLLTACSFGDCL